MVFRRYGLDGFCGSIALLAIVESDFAQGVSKFPIAANFSGQIIESAGIHTEMLQRR